MSTTGGTPQGTIGLLDPPDVVRKKFRSAVTDSGREVQRSDDKPGVSNLIDILSVASGQTPAEIEAQLRRQRLRPVQAGRRRGGRRAARAGAGAVRRAPGRRGRAAAAAGARRRQGTGCLEPDARADVRGDGLRAAVKRIGLIIAAIFAVVVVAGVLHYTDAPPVAVFVLSGAALGGVAWAIGIATESVGAKFGPAVTGVLQSTLGNLPEFFIVIFSLSAGELVVAQFSILGSLFANALLVLGLAIAVGATLGQGRRDALPETAAERHRDAAPALGVPDRDPRALGPGRRQGERASGGDLGGGRDLPAHRLRRLARRLPPRRQAGASSSRRSRPTTSCPSRGRSSFLPSPGSRRRSSRTGSSTRSTLRSRSSASRRRSRGS